MKIQPRAATGAGIDVLKSGGIPVHDLKAPLGATVSGISKIVYSMAAVVPVIMIR